MEIHNYDSHNAWGKYASSNWDKTIEENESSDSHMIGLSRANQDAWIFLQSGAQIVKFLKKS